LNLIAKVKLQPKPEEFASLRETLYRANECCNWLSEKAWEAQIFKKFEMQKVWYREARTKFDLTAQVVIRCIGKVADAYKTAFKLHRQRVAKVKKLNAKRAKEKDPAKQKEPKPLPEMKMVVFRKDGAMCYDQRILRWYVDDEYVSIWSLAGRLKIPFQAGERQRELLQSQKGESDLILYRGAFYLAAGCSIDDPTPTEVKEFLGVDLGVVNIATDSDGNVYSGSHVRSMRHRHRKLRTKLQKKGTKSARRKLKRLSGKERRFATNTNHVISKQIVALAKGTGRGIALEDLSGIRDRITARTGKQRYDLHSWAFFQLGQFILYKAIGAGVPEQDVVCKDSSRECAECGFVNKGNRPTRDEFCCLRCSSRKPADFNAALVIKSRASVNRPFVAYRADVSHSDLSDKPTALAVGR
jgi:IS605 OrfB family transposase